MGFATMQIKNRPDAMDAFTAVEGIYVLGGSGIESITRMIPAGTAYSGAGALTLTVIKGQIYEWVPGGSDASIANGAQTITLANTFVAQGTTVILHGTASATVTATLTLKVFFQKLWLYPAPSVTAGILGTNVASLNVGKSGTLVPQYLPDALAPSGGPLVYQFPDGQKMDLSQVILKGTAGDGVFFSLT